MAAKRFDHERAVTRIGKPVDRAEWCMSPQIVNAYYNAANNEIVFPAAILQPPFFDRKADDASNYGAIGMVIGHEITHGFDDRGRHFDKEIGNLREWWSARRRAARRGTRRKKVEAVRRVRRRRRHEGERQAHAGREHRRHRRREDRPTSRCRRHSRASRPRPTRRLQRRSSASSSRSPRSGARWSAPSANAPACRPTGTRRPASACGGRPTCRSSRAPSRANRRRRSGPKPSAGTIW